MKKKFKTYSLARWFFKTIASHLKNILYSSVNYFQKKEECGKGQHLPWTLNTHTCLLRKTGSSKQNIYCGRWQAGHFLHVCVCVVSGNGDILTSVYLSIISGKLSSFGPDGDPHVLVDINVPYVEGSLPNALKDQTCSHTHTQ